MYRRKVNYEQIRLRFDMNHHHIFLYDDCVLKITHVRQC